MRILQNQIFDEERALYDQDGIRLERCRFDGPADGESALKECRSIQVSDCYFNLRYPFWHDRGLSIGNSRMTEACRAALWYSTDILISNSQLHGIKALRECANITMDRCDVISAEFGWFTDHVRMTHCVVQGEYFMLRAQDLHFTDLHLKGKYSLQYIENAIIEDSILDTKDAFWHAKNVTVRNCTVKGEYLGWYSQDLTFENCRIVGTQPLCYCTGLKLINCEMVDTDLCFEKSEVEATVTSHVVSIKNPLRGYITVESAGELIRDDDRSKGIVILRSEADTAKAVQILSNGLYTCVLCHGDTILTRKDRGVLPLVRLLEGERDLRSFSAADKVVGKATAFLYCLLGVRDVYADVISEPALQVLQNAGIHVGYTTLVHHIINRAGDGICPFEAAVTEAPDAESAYRLIRGKMSQMGIQI